MRERDRERERERPKEEQQKEIEEIATRSYKGRQINILIYINVDTMFT